MRLIQCKIVRPMFKFAKVKGLSTEKTLIHTLIGSIGSILDSFDTGAGEKLLCALKASSHIKSSSIKYHHSRRRVC